MKMIRKVQCLAVAAAASLTGFAVPAAQAEELSYSFNIGGFSDYRFRGFSQTAEDPAIQGGVDLSYGIGYFGVWASNLDFGKVPGTSWDVANAEVDIYGGIKPVVGPVTFDLGVIYYWYPAAKDNNAINSAELDYVELKVGASGNLTNELAVGATFYWSPDYTGELGDVYTIEGTASYALPKFWVFDPSISGRLGYQEGDSIGYAALFGNGDDNYMYWDIGLTLAVEKIALDFRYVDTDVSNAGGFCTGATFQCDATFVGSVKITLP